MIDSHLQELLIVLQNLHPQLDLQIEELEQPTIRSESQCKRDWEKFITSSGKNLIPLVKPHLAVERNVFINLQRSAISVQRI